eukprot:CAMPEP_0174724378 /NCGR_PEP_ID=MMETSP1094-20130205/43220_1 /TAXON_ID=156173 /ORGANISM="Chrysochromulina brevifilum, Strain UTEX LB 985" /LENGTH=217 /DNA_ID=CAMNT_0015925587 /DNA_START=212 /DNA_END=865 /DNA_ORIENTATION=-
MSVGVRAEEDMLLDLVANGASSGAILKGFAALEAAAPTPDDLLLTPSGIDAIDGRWLLRATIAAQAGETDLEASGISNAVNASGIVVDTSKAPPVQEVNTGTKRIGNEISFALPLGATAFVRVAGGFDADSSSGRRANVEFDTLDVWAFRRRVLRAGWLFKLIKAVRPGALNGDDSSSWLDTTYLSDRVRLGRGNKGSVFVLERCPPDEGPLDAWPL